MGRTCVWLSSPTSRQPFPTLLSVPRPCVPFVIFFSHSPSLTPCSWTPPYISRLVPCLPFSSRWLMLNCRLNTHFSLQHWQSEQALLHPIHKHTASAVSTTGASFKTPSILVQSSERMTAFVNTHSCAVRDSCGHWQQAISVPGMLLLLDHQQQYLDFPWTTHLCISDRIHYFFLFLFLPCHHYFWIKETGLIPVNWWKYFLTLWFQPLLLLLLLQNILVINF